tara:strand:- start:504 stop:686 length:183 start_codon:yes stop_codon:yes gene_type:complete
MHASQGPAALIAGDICLDNSELDIVVFELIHTEASRKVAAIVRYWLAPDFKGTRDIGWQE